MEAAPRKKLYGEKITIGSDSLSIGKTELRFSEITRLSSYSDKWSPIAIFLAALTSSQIAWAILRRENHGILSFVFLAIFGLGTIVAVFTGIAAIRAKPQKIVVIGKDRKPIHFSGVSKADAERIEAAYADASSDQRSISNDDQT
tara:strand:+ start:599 stop:1033 length:435 start_codon:yes stop_codon:yes gene_type:complete